MKKLLMAVIVVNKLEKLEQVLAAEPNYNFLAVDFFEPDDTRIICIDNYLESFII